MSNYIRKVIVCRLFDQDADLTIEFNQSVNCIYGANGTGKTVLINLIVNSFRVNVFDLLRTPFSSITIFTANDGKERAEKFVTVEKVGDEINYVFYKKHSLKYESSIDNDEEFNVLKQIRYRPTTKGLRQTSLRTVKSDENIDINLIPAMILRKVIMNQVSLTYVPLLRHSDSQDYRISERDLHRQIGHDSERNEIVDPNVRVLKGLQDEFSRKYASAQSDIARRLESLSSTIFEKLLLSENENTLPNTSTKIINDLHTKGEVNIEQSKVDSVISQISDLHLNIPENKIRNHYDSWYGIQADFIKKNKILDESTNKDSGDSDEIKHKAIKEYSEAYYKVISYYNVHNKLEDAIKEIQKVHLSKQLVLSPFNKFKEEINRFLSKSKKFTFDDSGEFEFSNNGRILDISKLSSGEKHLIAILGRVTFSSFIETSTFIADEPELSLHLEWQREILPAIRRLSPNTQVIVATHAPAIISKDTNKIDIEECYKND